MYNLSDIKNYPHNKIEKTYLLNKIEEIIAAHTELEHFYEPFASGLSSPNIHDIKPKDFACKGDSGGNSGDGSNISTKEGTSVSSPESTISMSQASNVIMKGDLRVKRGDSGGNSGDGSNISTKEGTSVSSSESTISKCQTSNVIMKGDLHVKRDSSALRSVLSMKYTLEATVYAELTIMNNEKKEKSAVLQIYDGKKSKQLLHSFVLDKAQEEYILFSPKACISNILAKK
ncbi:unnamed protein product [Didymodactylos carnosus]|uniref:Uncharacterized protein n=1 Tax=Didymodactylos carnosus TaxID=1234261 RepID=A0A813XMD7_9BILA|nr:unnamed protein product [Didymodactylos carnosus]CAF3654774.1 unnamed protein product [Didymodactylos carnosus]